MQNEISKIKVLSLSPPLTLQAELLDYQQNEKHVTLSTAYINNAVQFRGNRQRICPE